MAREGYARAHDCRRISIDGVWCAPGHYEKPQGFSVSIQLKDPVDGERIFNAFAEGGTVVMPFSKTFWSPGFGMCVDQFGIPWMVNSGGEGWRLA
jgi:PhnB protein